MRFVDIATVEVMAGNGGNGAVSFRHEPFVARGGPNGGDGGKGGSVIFRADRNLNTLANFRHKQKLRAKDGENGTKANKNGRYGEDLVVKVPLGTVVIREGKEDVVDLSEDGFEAVVAKGGDGGYGNAHFTSSVRQAPNFAEKGEAGEEHTLKLELKMIADVGLVGLPNAGKSTFLSVVSNAEPEIADYPFTTLKPNLGVADVEDGSILIADIPGLIEGASEGKGLGDEFLRHVERAATLLHLIDVYSNDVRKDYETIMNELKNYKIDLSGRMMIVAFTKVENVDTEIIDMQKDALKGLVERENIYTISSIRGDGVNDLLVALKGQVEEFRETETAKKENYEAQYDDNVVRFTGAQEKAWEMSHDDDGSVRLVGRKIERFARRTDFDNEQGVYRLRDIMLKMGIERELKRRKVEPGTKIYIGKTNQYKIEY